MPLNPLDDAMAELPPVPVAAPVPAAEPDDAYDRILKGRQAGTEQRLRTALVQADATAPDRAAEAQRLSERTNIPTSVVLRNFDAIQRRAKLTDTPYARMLTETPALAEWASVPEHAAVAHDDMEQLGALEWLVKAMPRAVQQTVDQVRYSQLRYREILGQTLTREELDQKFAYQQASTDGGELGAGDSWFRHAITGAGQLVAQGFRPAVYAAAGGAGGLVLGGIGGSIVPGAGTVAGALAGAQLGMEAGFLWGGFKTTAQQEATQAYDEMIALPDEMGHPIDPSVARIAAIAVGGLNGLIEVGELKLFQKSFPGLDQLKGKLSRTAMQTALRSPTIRAAFGEMARVYGTTLAGEVAQEVAQRAIAVSGEELSKAASGQSTQALRSPREWWDTLSDEAIGAVQSFALGIAPGPVLGFAHQVQRARAAANSATFFKALGEGVANSKTAQRLPEAAQAFIAKATEGGPLETLYQPVETWAQYWQGKGIDPAEMAAVVTGDRNAYARALAEGTDLAIPTAEYAAKLAGTEHNEFFANELRLGAEAMNQREVDTLQEQIKAATEGGATTPAVDDPVRASILQQLIEQGKVAPDAAERYANLITAAVGSQAERAGVDPVALYASYGLRIERPDLQAAEAALAAAKPVTEQTIEKPAAPALPLGPEGTPTSAEAAGVPAVEVDAAATAAQTGTPDEQTAATPTAQAGEQPVHPAREQPAVDARGATEGPGDGTRVEHRRLSAAEQAERFPEPEIDEVFARQPQASTEARLTPAVERELARILEELVTYPYTEKTWNWLGPGDKNTGNAAGGKADIVAASGGAKVYNDILYHAPVNLVTSGKTKGQPAKNARGERAKVQAAIQKALETRDVHNNLAEGALRVAERRAAGAWRGLNPAELPPVWGTIAPVELTDALSAMIDDATTPTSNLLADETGISDADLEAQGDTSFNITEFEQGLFDDITEPDPTVDTLTAPGTKTDLLDTGEQQPRLPGDVGDVREAEKPTPEFEVPFALTPTVDKGRKGKQTTLFQSVYHGSPHRFEAFSLHAIGSGEGAQAYGWGLYFASKRELADRYRESLAGKPTTKRLTFEDPERGTVGVYESGGIYTELLNERNEGDRIESAGGKATAKQRDAGRMILGLNELHARAYYSPVGKEGVARMRDDLERSVKNVEGELAQGRTMSGDARRDRRDVDTYKAAIEVLDRYGDKLDIAGPDRPGRTYTVEIPDDEDFLDYDKPLSEQSPKVKAALEALGVNVEDVRYPPLDEARMRLTVRLETLQNAAAHTSASARDLERIEQLREGLYHVNSGTEADFRAWWLKHAGEVTGWGDIETAAQTGASVYRELEEQYGKEIPTLRSAEAASKALATQGVAGVRYLDGNSRRAGEGSSNYVVFDDKLVAITEFDQSAVPVLTNDVVRAWAEDVKQRLGPDVAALDLYVTNAGDIKLDTLAITRGARRAGLGSDVMREVTRLADQHGARIVLSVADRGFYADVGEGDRGTTSRSRLVAFYKRFGFVENRGRYSDLSLSESMYREPTLRGDLGQPIEPPTGGHVATLTGTELGEEFSDLKDLRRAGIDYYRREFQHGLKTIDRPGFGRIAFTRVGRDHLETFSANADKLRVIPAIPAILEHGDYLGRAASHKTRRDGIVAFHIFAADVQLGDRVLRVTTLVGEDRAGNRFYDLRDPTVKASVDRGDISTAPKPSEGGGTTLDQSVEDGGTDVNVAILDQTEAAPTSTRRGAIRFGVDRQFTIALLERADLSTFLHETGHFFLELMGDLVEHVGAVDPSLLTPGQRGLMTDYATLLQSFGVESREAITTEHHEQFARSFEAYLMEGRAPSLALQGAFSRFRAWLLGVYQTVSALRVHLTPEVRGVMDRLLASDHAIAEAEARRGSPPMFATAELAGMTEAQFGLYQQTVETAHRTARERLDRQLMAEVQREQTATWRAQRAEIKTAVQQEVQARPVYQALAGITRGERADGTPLAGLDTPPLRLSRAAIAEAFGAARVARLPRGAIAATDGLDPNVVAEMYGYSSGDELLSAIEAAPPIHAVVAAETSRRMIEAHGSLLLDGTLAEAAQAATANDDRDLILRAELRALGQLRRTVAPHVALERQTGKAALAAEKKERSYERRWMDAEAKLRLATQKGESQVTIDALTDEVNNLKRKARGGAATINAAIPPAGMLREMATTRIGAMPIRSIRPGLFWSASRRAAQQAIDRAARQDFDGAIVAKQQELINLTLYREAEKQLEFIASRVRFAKNLTTQASRAKLGLAGGSYLDQVDGILDRYGFTPATQRTLDRLVNMRAWVAGLESQGIPVDLPDEVLDDTRRQNYQELTVETFTGVTDGLKAIVHLAALKNRLLKSADARAFAEIRDGVVNSIRDHKAERPVELEPGQNAARRAIADWFASHTKISDIAQRFDGYTDGGPMWSAFMLPLNVAGDAEETRKGETATAYAAIVERYYPGRELGVLHAKLAIPAIGGSLSREGRIAVALNWGNATSRERLLNDPVRKWNRFQVQAILATLDKRDWDFVQATWDHINTFWPEIAAKQERVTGLAPEKVEAIPVTTRFGEYAGGYYPLAYDTRLSARATQNEMASQAKLTQASAYVRSTTKRGHLETRKTHVELPIRLELSVAFGHFEQVIHDLTHHETLIDVTRLLRDSQVTKAILETHGDLIFKQLTSALQDIAIGSRPAAGTRMEKAANWMKNGTQLAAMGWNLWTATQQPMGVFNGAWRVGAPWVAKGMIRWLRDSASMESTSDWISSVSPMMANRANTATQDLHDLRATFSHAGGWFDSMVRKVSADHVTQASIRDSYLWHIGMAQRVADIPTWLGQYEKSRAAGEPEERAYRLADQAVLDSQGGGQIKDLAAVQRGTPMAQAFMSFYSYGNTLFNSFARAGYQADFHSSASVAKLLGGVSLFYVIPAAGQVMLAHAFGRTGPDDDTPEGWLKDMGRQLLGDAMNTMVFVRELGGLVREGSRGYAGPAGIRLIELVYKEAGEIEQGKADEGLARATNTLAGVIFRYPSAQLARTVDGWIALQEGRTHNPGVLLMGPPPKAQAR